MHVQTQTQVPSSLCQFLVLIYNFDLSLNIDNWLLNCLIIGNDFCMHQPLPDTSHKKAFHKDANRPFANCTGTPLHGRGRGSVGGGGGGGACS